MKSYPKKWGKLFERYLDEYLPERKDEICARADREYRKLLTQITVERGCGRLEWACLDWNQPSIDFYRSLGAVPMDEWTTYRLTGDTLLEMAK